MRFSFQSRSLALLALLMLLAPSVLLLAAQQPAGVHECCADREGFRMPADPPRCCVIKAPPAPQPLGPAASDASVAQALVPVTTPEFVPAGYSESFAPDHLAPSPPPGSPVLRI